MSGLSASTRGCFEAALSVMSSAKLVLIVPERWGTLTEASMTSISKLLASSAPDSLVTLKLGPLRLPGKPGLRITD